MFARVKPLLDREGILSLLNLSIAELTRKAESYKKRLCALTGAVKAYPVTSGRAAVVLALRTVGVGSRDEVVIPALTCPALADAIIAVGAIPHLCDISPDGLSIRPWSLDRILARKRSRAVIDAPLIGTVPAVEAVADVCQEAGVPLIMDVAQAVGCFRSKRSIASFGRLAVLSTNFDKPFSTGRGGALLVFDRSLVAAADELYLSLRTQTPEEEIKVLKGLAIGDTLFSSPSYKPFISIEVAFKYAEAEGDAYDLQDLFFSEAGNTAAAKAVAAVEKLSPRQVPGFWRRVRRRLRPSSAVPDVGPIGRLGHLLSAVGDLHLSYLVGEGARRRDLVKAFDREFTGYRAVEHVRWTASRDDISWPLRYAFLLRDYRAKADVIARCERAGYEAGAFIYPRPLSGQFPYFKLSRHAGRYLSGAWRVAAGIINLPIHLEIALGDVEKMVQAVKR